MQGERPAGRLHFMSQINFKIDHLRPLVENGHEIYRIVALADHQWGNAYAMT